MTIQEMRCAVGRHDWTEIGPTLKDVVRDGETRINPATRFCNECGHKQRKERGVWVNGARAPKTRHRRHHDPLKALLYGLVAVVLSVAVVVVAMLIYAFQQFQSGNTTAGWLIIASVVWFGGGLIFRKTK